MALRRMFSKTITNSSQFLMMPPTSQTLYFHLGMNADDDGFCEHFTVMRMTESKPDDLRVLETRGFVHVFDDKVLVIRDWRENNYLRSDRYTPSKYLLIYEKEIKQITGGIPNVNHAGDKRDTQDRLGKDRKGKDKKRERVLPKDLSEVVNYAKEQGMIIDPEYFYKYFSTSNWVDSEGNVVMNFKLKMHTWNKREMDKRKKEQTTKGWPML